MLNGDLVITVLPVEKLVFNHHECLEKARTSDGRSPEIDIELSVLTMFVAMEQQVLHLWPWAGL